MSENRNLHRDLLALGLLALAIFFGAALVTYHPTDPVAERLGPLAKFYSPDQLEYPANAKTQNACGRWGALVANVGLTGLGIGAHYALISLIILVVAMLRRQQIDGALLRLIGWITSLAGLTTLAAILLPNWSPGPMMGAGGALGALGSSLLNHHFALAGSLILAAGITLGGLLLCSDYLVLRTVRLFVDSLFWLARGRRRIVDAVAETARARAGGRTDMEGKGGAATRSPNSRDNAMDDLSDDEPAILPIRVRKKETVPAAERRDDDESRPATLRMRAADDRDDRDQDDGDDDGDREALRVAGSTVDEEGTGGKRGGARRRAARATSPAPETPAANADDTSSTGSHPHFKMKKLSDRSAAREEVRAELEQAPEASADDYELPGIDLLVAGEDFDWESQEKEVRRKAKILEKTFADFGFKVKVVEIETGPVIAQYEVELEAGLRLSKITALADDLAIALRVPSVRIVAPIPGKNTVGIEVPNEQRQVVRLREVIEESNGKIKKMRIPLFLGKDVSGSPLTVDLSTLPHLLIAGRTGTGKSVCLNAIISSILMTRRPDEVRLIMIDPKMVELSGYGRLPHLMHPVVTDMRKAEAILAWAVEKMEERYSLLARAGVRHIANYNQLGEGELMERLQPEDDDARNAIPRQLPFIVIVADEIADMMMTAGKEVEQHIIRLAQKSRAVGIHLILATQKPTVDVITGLIKSNLPARISFQVASRVDSRVVLDEMGADKLLGNGDMLFLWPGTSTLLRGQGTYLGDDEINRLVDCCSHDRPQNFVTELVNIKIKDDGDGDVMAALKKRDELYESAVDVVVREGRGSVSLLQRALGIGYGRAARLIDFMAEDGIVGQYAGSQAREVLLTVEDWERMQGQSSDENPPPPAPAPSRPAASGGDGWSPPRRTPDDRDAARGKRPAPTPRSEGRGELRTDAVEAPRAARDAGSVREPRRDTRVDARGDERETIRSDSWSEGRDEQRPTPLRASAARRGIISLARPDEDEIEDDNDYEDARLHGDDRSLDAEPSSNESLWDERDTSRDEFDDESPLESPRPARKTRRDSPTRFPSVISAQDDVESGDDDFEIEIRDENDRQ